jgi:hypothetical protein
VGAGAVAGEAGERAADDAGIDAPERGVVEAELVDFVAAEIRQGGTERETSPPERGSSILTISAPRSARTMVE